ncbi:MAG: hypothetical protein LC689_09435 [Myxococcales bacterium]|nr:hypothetical protein [Myxococcales bacterium]
MRSALVLACCACTVSLGGGGNNAVYQFGPAGGAVTTPAGVTLELPAGALKDLTQITVAQSDGPADALSPRVSFEPAIALAVPATLSFGVTDDTATLQWNDTPVEAAVTAGTARAQIPTLGSGYFRRPPPGRTVTGRLSTVYGSTVVGGAPGADMHVTALWVGQRRIPVVESPDYSFSVAHVPQGPYLLEVDTIVGDALSTAQLFELTTSAPDLSMVSAARPDVRYVTRGPQVTLDISNLMPWVLPAGAYTGDLLLVAGAQADAFGRPRGVHPSSSATSWHGTFDWGLMSTTLPTVAGLPEAAKGDVEYVYQRSTEPIGAGVVHRVKRYARIDSLTLADSTPANLSFALADAPQTGSLHVDIRGSQWAPLATQVNPAAGFGTTTSGGVTILAEPHEVAFPNLPFGYAQTSIFWLQAPDGADVNYGDVPYGQFLGPDWKEVRYAAWFFASPDNSVGGEIFAMDPMPVTSPIVPRLGPPRSPQIAGRDAFVAQTGVGSQPVISWSPPSLGRATSYLLMLTRMSGAGVQSVQITVHGATSVSVPAGFLQTGAQYAAVIAAISVPWDGPDAPAFRTGVPMDYAECATASFSP